MVLVIVDTVRADHLSCYGSARPTSPNLDRLATGGELYTNAWAQSPWTLPSVASILTGLPVGRHGAGKAPGGGFFPLRSDVPTLADAMRSAGYRTAAFVNVEFLSPGSGLERGFEVYDYRPSASRTEPPRDARETTDDALRWLAGVGSAPFFLLVHYFDPHLPFSPPPPFDTMFSSGGGADVPADFGTDVRLIESMRTGAVTPSAAERETLVARYDGEISFVDEQIGLLLGGLERHGVWNRAFVTVVSDHGEELWDHGGFEHGHSHYAELLRVPLIVRRPGGRPFVSDGRVRQIDIAPTVLRHVGLPQPRSLAGELLGPQADAPSIALGTLWAGTLASIRADAGTLILDLQTGERQLFAPEDARESANVLDQRQEAAVELERALLDAVGQGGGSDATWQMSEELRAQLRALGYVRD